MIALKSKKEVDNIKTAGSVVRGCLDCLSNEIKPGVSTKELEEIAEEFIRARNAKAAFLGYKGFPAAICASPNEVIVHGIPSKEMVLKDGDIISIDVGVGYGGYFADAARTFKVGKVSPEAERLIEVTKEALQKGVSMARTGNRVGDISWAIQSFVESHGFTVVKAFVGHGIGKRIHQDPEIPNFGQPHSGKVLEDGMALAIEPMVNAGTAAVKILDDGWTAVTEDGGLSCHFEHTVLVEKSAGVIIT